MPFFLKKKAFHQKNPSEPHLDFFIVLRLLPLTKIQNHDRLILEEGSATRKKYRATPCTDIYGVRKEKETPRGSRSHPDFAHHLNLPPSNLLQQKNDFKVVFLFFSKTYIILPNLKIHLP